MTTKLFEKKLLDFATEPYRTAGKFAWHFAHGKLSGDPAFKEILQRGLVSSKAHVVDIGCGQGLFSAWMLAAEAMAQDALWPKSWAAAPQGVSVQGIDLLYTDIVRAETAHARHSDRMKFVEGDMCTTTFDKAQVVVILDVLHYVPIAAQDEVLKRVREALQPKGLLILRVGDSEAGLRFTITNFVDKLVTLLRSGSPAQMHCRPLLEWQRVLQQLGFRVETKPMSQGTPFANVLLLAHVGQALD